MAKEKTLSLQKIVAILFCSILLCSITAHAWTGNSLKSMEAASQCHCPVPLTTKPTKPAHSSWSRRQTLSAWIAATGILISESPAPAVAYTPDSDKLRESLYLISRVQEATVQQQRFVSRSKLQEELRNKMKLTLRLVEKNYLLLDQINYASNFVEPKDEIVTASEAGNEAVDALQNAIDYVNTDLKTGPLKDEQREYLTDAMMMTREKLFVFLKYMPTDKLEAARRRVEEENVKNREEFDGDEDAGVYNPVILPWKQK